jgi:hypothetical protein
MKVTNVFKFIITALLVTAFAVSVMSCKKVAIAEEQAETEVAFTGLEIEGLSHVWQNNRWEYVDSNDGLVAGFWNEKEGKYEHTANVLKGEWKGLFVFSSIKEINNNFKNIEEGGVENWEDGKVHVPIPFEIPKGGIVEEVKALREIINLSKPKDMIAIKDLPDQANIFSPFLPDVGKISFTGFSVPPEDPDYKVASVGMMLSKGLFSLNFDFKDSQECLVPDVDYSSANIVDGVVVYNNPDFIQKEVVLGTPILKVGMNDLIPKSFLIRINPFLGDGYQVLLSVYSDNQLSNFNFNNFLRDNKGRFIYINPSQSELENQIKEQGVKKDNSEEKIVDERQKEVELKIKEAPSIDGLDFNKKDGKYIARINNDYGLEEGVEAGVFINGFVGLDTKIIKFLQDKSENLENFKIPLPIDFSEVDNVKLQLDFVKILIITFSGNATVYSPISGSCYRGFSPQPDYYEALFFEMENGKELQIESKAINYLSDNEMVKIGDKVAEIEKKIILDLKGLGKADNILELSSEEVLEMGLDNILKIGETPVFILSNES